MFREYRSAHVSYARKQVFAVVHESPSDPAPLGKLPDEVRPHVFTVCHYLDNLGVLVAEDLMDPRVAARYLGDTAVALWERLCPYIQAERAHRMAEKMAGGGDYLRYFEDLAVTLNALNPEQTRASLKRWS